MDKPKLSQESAKKQYAFLIEAYNSNRSTGSQISTFKRDLEHVVLKEITGLSKFDEQLSWLRRNKERIDTRNGNKISGYIPAVFVDDIENLRKWRNRGEHEVDNIPWDKYITHIGTMSRTIEFFSDVPIPDEIQSILNHQPKKKPNPAEASGKKKNTDAMYKISINFKPSAAIPLSEVIKKIKSGEVTREWFICPPGHPEKSQWPKIGTIKNAEINAALAEAENKKKTDKKKSKPASKPSEAKPQTPPPKKEKKSAQAANAYILRYNDFSYPQYTLEEIKQKIAKGEISRDYDITQFGSAAYSKIDAIPELKRCFENYEKNQKDAEEKQQEAIKRKQQEEAEKQQQETEQEQQRLKNQIIVEQYYNEGIRWLKKISKKWWMSDFDKIPYSKKEKCLKQAKACFNKIREIQYGYKDSERLRKKTKEELSIEKLSDSTGYRITFI